MKKVILASMIVLSLLTFSHLAFSWDINPSQDVRDSGNIHGIIDYCGPNGSMGMEIYIPGKSFLVKTGTSGEFTLSHVPEGIYNVMFMLSGAIIGSVSEVNVIKKSVTEIGIIEICPDNDNDGHHLDVDCDDNNPSIYPGAIEVCNGKDDDCDGFVDGDLCLNCDDNDSDGYYAQDGCPNSLGVDCNDNDNLVNPGADEVCDDGIDNNCDGNTDEDCLQCTPGNPCDPGVYPVGVCNGITGVYDQSCNCIPIYPDNYNMIDICDGLDNDCDGETDEDCISSDDQDGDGYNSIASGGTDCDDTNPRVNPGATEVVGNGVDEDCDGVELCYRDNDNDGYGTNDIIADDGDLVCDDDGESPTAGFDCNDSDPSTYPGAPEICGDGIDNNCNGETDEGCAT